MPPTDRFLIPWQPRTAQGTHAPNKEPQPVSLGACLVDPETPPPTAWTLYQAARFSPIPPQFFIPDPAHNGQPWYEDLLVFEDLEPHFVPEIDTLPMWTAFDEVAFRPTNLHLDIHTRRAGKTHTYTCQACLYLPHSDRNSYNDGPQPVAARYSGLSIETVVNLLYKAYFAFNEAGDTYDTQKERFLRYAEATAARMLYDPDSALETAVKATALPVLSFLMTPGRRFNIAVNGPSLTVSAAESSQHDLVREPDAGGLHVRTHERRPETEL